MTLEQLVEEHDELMYGIGPRPSLLGHHELRKLAHLTIVNALPTLEQLWAVLDDLDLPNTDRLRPRWDTYFMVRAIYLYYKLARSFPS